MPSYSSVPANNQFAFTGISKKLAKETPHLSIRQQLENCEFFKIENDILTGVQDSHPIKISLSITPAFKNLQGLFNGLISLGQAREVKLSYLKSPDTYELTYNISDQTAVSVYLGKLIGMIKAELRFKSVLRTIIDNQKAFDASQQLLKKEIFQ